jgi:putative PIN family toxin of toxin-antitoxin system
LLNTATFLKRPKFGLPESLVQQWLDLIQMRTLVIPSPATTMLPRDPKDAMFLAAAVAANAGYLITGDNDLLQGNPDITTQIVTPAQFAAVFGVL